MGTPDRQDLFWLDRFEGKARGGYYVRSDLSKLIKKLEETGQKVVGIEVDGTWNLHLITEAIEQAN